MSAEIAFSIGRSALIQHLVAASLSPTVFISHSSQDRAIAETVCEALERRGFACWLASRDIGPGQNFQEAIVKAIRSVRAMVLVFTGNSNNSDEIKKEVALASQNHLVLIPLRVEDVLPSDAFLYELSTRQWIDAFDDWDRAIGRLAEQIGEVTAGPGRAPASAPHGVGPRRPAMARSRRLRTAWLVAGFVVLLVAGGLAFRLAVSGTPTAGTALPEAAATPHISGNWVTGSLVNPYDRNQTSVLHFAFEQSGETLLGTVTEKTRFGGTAKGIQGGRVKANSIVFSTQGMTTSGGGEQPYKDQYHGRLKGNTIEFIRQNDVASGGLSQKFTAQRE